VPKIKPESNQIKHLRNLVSNSGVLVVVHCYRAKGNIIRIISARKATREEQRHYL